VPNDPYDLQRFVEAQAPVIERVWTEMRAGRKASHWMWFVFPQIDGLGFSDMARRYAIGSAQEARAYLGHPVLGPRLKDLSSTVAEVEGRTAHEIFGSPDDLKFRSSMTLFDAVAPGQVFRQALDRFFEGRADPATLELLAEAGGSPSADAGEAAPGLGPEGVEGAGVLPGRGQLGIRALDLLSRLRRRFGSLREP
jgi:uncharacterized protein (DUF1810 family)